VKDILATESLPLLARFAWSNVVLAFDYDGTLAPIVDDPAEAYMRKRTSRLLRRLAKVYPCVVISGRTLADTWDRLDGAAVFEAIGNHGIEPWHPPERFARQVLSWAPELHERLAVVDGVVIENKVLSIAVHYRGAARREQARSLILDAVRKLDDARILGGKCAVHVVPRDAPHKGMALLAARGFLCCDTAVYVGDDETDEDVFELDERQDVLSIRVEPSPRSAAGFSLPDQQSVDLLLSRLLELRGTPSAWSQ
jgi:trehalose 6-phosphate phosphatase